MEAFHSGKATTLVATDIAARGIHVDDVALVVHADPPAEHKAYLHRSGRTARAGAAGTVITLMTDQQVKDVRALTRAAGIKPTTTRISGPDHPLLPSSLRASASWSPVASRTTRPRSSERAVAVAAGVVAVAVAADVAGWPGPSQGAGRSLRRQPAPVLPSPRTVPVPAVATVAAPGGGGGSSHSAASFSGRR